MHPMNKIKIVMCSFGVFIGIIFPMLVDYFVVWIPERKIFFNISCVIAGLIVGIFGYSVVKVILDKIDNKYKEIIHSKLGVQVHGNASKGKDILIAMQDDFGLLLDEFAEFKRRDDERLKVLASTDKLTELYNVRYLDEYINNLDYNLNEKIGILFCDIDYFKRINDTFGHDIGDLVLKTIASIMKECIRDEGKVLRYGGEEFLIIIENLCEEKVIKMAEELRIKISQYNILNFCKDNKKITVSIGVAQYPKDGQEIRTVINKADKAMYKAKQNGRDKCCIYKESTY